MHPSFTESPYPSAGVRPRTQQLWKQLISMFLVTLKWLLNDALSKTFNLVYCYYIWVRMDEGVRRKMTLVQLITTKRMQQCNMFFSIAFFCHFLPLNLTHWTINCLNQCHTRHEVYCTVSQRDKMKRVAACQPSNQVQLPSFALLITAVEEDWRERALAVIRPNTISR